MSSLPNSIHLSIYDRKPQMEFSIDEIEKAAISRLAVLRWIETRTLQKRRLLPKQFRRTNECKQEENTKYLTDILAENHLLSNHQYDNLSHFILRLAFTEIGDYTSWFIKHETSLFESKFRLSSPNSDNIKRIESILFNNITYPLYNANDIILNDLNGRSPIPHFDFNTNCSDKSRSIQSAYFPFHILPFEQCSNKLIAQRKVFIRNGYAFVPHFLYPQIVCNQYFKYLKKQMKKTKVALNKMKKDQAVMYELSKIMHLIKKMDKISLSADNRYIHVDDNARNMQLRHYNIDSVSHLFPLCMKYSHHSLLKHGHLKNNARVHFGLFLKGIGLSLEESLIYFEKRFTQKRSKFRLEYAYLIKHFYGKKGGLKNYSPFNCSRIIQKSANIGDGDHCGCPFQLFDDESLKKFIKECYDVDINVDNAKDIEQQLKCKQLFHLLNGDVLRCEHAMDIEDIYSDWNHPNRYFDINYDLQYLDSQEFRKKHHRNGVLTKNFSSSSPVAIEYSL